VVSGGPRFEVGGGSALLARRREEPESRRTAPRYRPVGWALTVGPILLALAMTGPALVVTTGLAAGTVLLAAAVTGFHELAHDQTPHLIDPTRLDAEGEAL